jgi:exonuclease III
MRYSRSDRGFKNFDKLEQHSHQASNRNAVNSRIDRFYLSDFFIEKGGTIGIQPGTTLSDHVHVILKFNSDMGRRNFKFQI